MSRRTSSATSSRGARARLRRSSRLPERPATALIRPVLDFRPVDVCTKFEIVIPKEIRERMELRPGQVVSLIERDGMVTLVPQRPLSELRGILKGVPTRDHRDETDRF